MAIVAMVTVVQPGRNGEQAVASAAASDAGAIEATSSPPDASGGPAVEVVTTVVERTGVPNAIADRMWLSSDYQPALAGELGTTALIKFPESEMPVAAADGIVATVTNGDLFAKERTSTLRVRDVRTGNVLRQFDTALYVDQALIAGDVLLFTGPGAQATGGFYPGGGIWATTTTGDATPILVIAPEPDPVAISDVFGEGYRGAFQASESGGTVASSPYLRDGRRTDIIDVTSVKLRSTLPGYVFAVTDDLALATSQDPSSDSIAAVEIDSGETRWVMKVGASVPATDDAQLERPGLIAGFARSDGVVLQYQKGLNLIIDLIDMSDGEAKRLLVQDLAGSDVVPLYVASDLSTVDSIVLLQEIGVGSAIEEGGGEAWVTILNAVTGNINDQAFKVGGP